MALFDVIVYSIIKYGACSIKPALFSSLRLSSIFRRLWLIPHHNSIKTSPPSCNVYKGKFFLTQKYYLMMNRRKDIDSPFKKYIFLSNGVESKMF